MIPVVVGSNPIGHPNLAPPRKWHRPALAELATPTKAVCAIFGAALAQVGANARGVVQGTDPEYLHQMRVGFRRLRSALRAFHSIIGKRNPVVRRLRRLMPAFGEARDWDVFCDGIARIGAQAPERAPEMAQLLARARSRRGAARRRARAAAGSRELRAFLLRALRWLQTEPCKRRMGKAAGSLGEFAARSLERLHRKALSKARDMDWQDPGRRHRMRIRVKRLRYACDFFAPSFAGASARSYIKRLEALQGLLGDLNDISVAHRLLDDLAPRGSAPGIAAAAAHARRVLGARERMLVTSLAPAWTVFEKSRPFWRPRE